MNIKTRITKIHYDKNAKGVFVDMLEFFSVFYGLVSRLRNTLYDKGILKTVKVDAKVISVGNVTTGGVGKTPVVSKLAQYFSDNDEKVAIISRGYGGRLSNKKVNLISDGVNVYYNAKEAGDEAYWHAVNTPMCSILTCKDKVKAARYAVEKIGCTVIILDDGFQYRHLYRDLNLLLIDSEKGFGNEKLLPAGPLREGKEAFDRVDKIVVVNKGNDKKRAERYSKIIEKKLGHKSFVCQTEPDYIYNIVSEEKLASGEPINAVCAIGQPESFFKFLEPNFEIMSKVVFDDHHIYKNDEIEKIKGIIVTTEKDAVKMSDIKRKDIYAMKLKVDLNIEELLAD